ncbi:unnamed protein product, partial [Rotaria sp. Silwood2]
MNPAYETLSDHDKRKKYHLDGEWIQDVPLEKYTLQQLAAEPELVRQLKIRLQNATYNKFVPLSLTVSGD